MNQISQVRVGWLLSTIILPFVLSGPFYGCYVFVRIANGGEFSWAAFFQILILSFAAFRLIAYRRNLKNQMRALQPNEPKA